MKITPREERELKTFYLNLKQVFFVMSKNGFFNLGPRTLDAWAANTAGKKLLKILRENS